MAAHRALFMGLGGVCRSQDPRHSGRRQQQPPNRFLPFSRVGNSSAKQSTKNDRTAYDPSTYHSSMHSGNRIGRSGGSHPEALIRLDGTNSTLLLIRRREGLPEIAYWGRRLPQEISEAEIFAVRAPDSPNNGPDQWRPLITLLDTIGCWNFDMPGLIAARPDGSGWTANFETEQVAREGQRLVVRGKTAYPGLR
ncbi:hypothetical protein ACFSHR_15380 [Azotobacter chroococcum]